MTVTGASIVDVERWRKAGAVFGHRVVADERPVAIVHDGATTAVLMATPTDLDDLAAGFSLTEGIVDDLSQIASMESVKVEGGYEARVWLTGEVRARLAARRRRMAGPTGCGLCGIESLAEAIRPVARVRFQATVDRGDLIDAMAEMERRQALGQTTRAVHAAAFYRPGGIVAIREDVGRHNALDKLIGGLARAGEEANGVVLLTSRVSVEMVQKVAAFGAPMLCAVSAPTMLAIETAKAAGITLIAVCRADGFEVFSEAHPPSPASTG